MAFKKSNSSAGEEFAARKRPPLGPKDQIDVNDIETLSYYITDYGKILPARITGVTAAQ
jgi:ribosomal protein S18